MSTKRNSEETLGQSIFIKRKHILVQFYMHADYGWLTTDTVNTFDTFSTYWNRSNWLLNNKQIALNTNSDTVVLHCNKKTSANTINDFFRQIPFSILISP